jgi:transposase-like protein
MLTDSLCNVEDPRQTLWFSIVNEMDRQLVYAESLHDGKGKAAKRIVMPGIAHRQHRYLNNRAENSHQPTREREKRMRRFKSAQHAQRFVEVHGIIASHFRPRRHLLSAAEYRQLRSKRFRVWNEVTRTAALA